MNLESREKTAFDCGMGLYQFKVMTFGLKKVLATFQQLMEVALGELKETICFVYLDQWFSIGGLRTSCQWVAGLG